MTTSPGKSDDTIVMNGDIVTDINLKAVYEDHISNNGYNELNKFTMKKKN